MGLGFKVQAGEYREFFRGMYGDCIGIICKDPLPHSPSSTGKFRSISKEPHQGMPKTIEFAAYVYIIISYDYVLFRGCTCVCIIII